MFCPNCRAEYREGYTVCADCGVALIPELPPEPSKRPPEPETQSALVTVYESYSLPNIAIAKSILEGAGIDFISRDELAEAYFVVGPVTIQAASGDAERARELLAELDEAGLVSDDLAPGDLSGDDAHEPPG